MATTRQKRKRHPGTREDARIPALRPARPAKQPRICAPRSLAALNICCYWHTLPPELTSAVHARLSLIDLWRLSQTSRIDRLAAWSALDRTYNLKLGFPTASRFFQPDSFEILLRGMFALCTKGFDPDRAVDKVWAAIWDPEGRRLYMRRVRERFKVLASLTSAFATIHPSEEFARASIVLFQKTAARLAAVKKDPTQLLIFNPWSVSTIPDPSIFYLASLDKILATLSARLQHVTPLHPRQRSLAAISSLFSHLQISHTLSLLPYAIFERHLTTLCTYALPGTDTDTLRAKIRVLGSVRDALVKVTVKDSDLPVAMRVMAYTLREVMRALRMFKLRMCEYMMRNAEVIRQVFWLSPGGKGKEVHLARLDHIVCFDKLFESPHNIDADPAEHAAIARCQQDWRALMDEASRGVGPDRAALWGEERVTREGARFLKGLEEYVLA